MGGARQSGLVVGRRQTLFPQGREQRAIRRQRASRHRRAAQRHVLQHREPAGEGLRRGRRIAPAPLQSRLQRRCPGRRGPAPGDPEERAPLVDRDGLCAPGAEASQLHRDDRRGGKPGAVGERPSGGGGARRRARRRRPARDRPLGGSHRLAQDPDAVGDRRPRGSRPSRDRARPPPAGRRQESAGPHRHLRDDAHGIADSVGVLLAQAALARAGRLQIRLRAARHLLVEPDRVGRVHAHRAGARPAPTSSSCSSPAIARRRRR